MELIRRVPLFAGCSRAELAKVAQLADELTVPEGKELTREGAPGREFFVVVEGGAVVRRKGRKVATVESGDFLGEIALLANVPRSATVVTTEESRLLVITDRAFRSLLRDAPSISAKVLHALAERVAPQLA